MHLAGARSKPSVVRAVALRKPADRGTAAPSGERLLTDAILFYGHGSGPYAAFSNWYDGAPIELDGATWALHALLLSTGTRRIQEDCADPWWRGGPNFPAGRDWLGRNLMDVRGELRGR